MLEFSLEVLQSNSIGFFYLHRPDRASVGPAHLCALWNGVMFYAATPATRSEFAPFLATVQHDYQSSETGPHTFQQPIYYKLREVVRNQLLTSFDVPDFDEPDFA